MSQAVRDGNRPCTVVHCYARVVRPHCRESCRLPTSGSTGDLSMSAICKISIIPTTISGEANRLRRGPMNWLPIWAWCIYAKILPSIPVGESNWPCRPDMIPTTWFRIRNQAVPSRFPERTPFDISRGRTSVTSHPSERASPLPAGLFKGAKSYEEFYAKYNLNYTRLTLPITIRIS